MKCKVLYITLQQILKLTTLHLYKTVSKQAIAALKADDMLKTDYPKGRTSKISIWGVYEYGNSIYLSNGVELSL